MCACGLMFVMHGIDSVLLGLRKSSRKALYEYSLTVCSALGTVN